MDLMKLTSVINKGLHSTKSVTSRVFSSNPISIFKQQNSIIINNKKVSFSSLIKAVFKQLKYKISRPIANLAYLGSLENNRKLLTEYISKNFSTIKSNLTNVKLEKSFLEKINTAETPDELCSIIHKYIRNNTMNLTDKINLTRINPKLLCAEKDLIINQEKNLHFAKIFELEKALSVKSTNPKCIELEQRLKKEFGLEMVSLKDDYIQGQRILKVCELLKSNGENIPKNFIVSNSIVGNGQALQKQSCILINSSNSQNLSNSSRKIGWSSTENDLHELLHECGHIIQPTNIYTRTIPNDLMPTVKTLSGYAAFSKSSAEIFAELFAKRQLLPQKFTQEEELLFKFLAN